MHIKDILQRKGEHVVTISATDTLHDASRVLNEHKIGGLVVTDAAGRYCIAAPVELEETVPLDDEETGT